MEGYKVKNYGAPVKRYCQTLSLKDNPKLIEMYKKVHSKESVWAEVLEGIRSVGILEMELYLSGNQAFMIVETPLDFDWDSAMTKLATLPRQAEWEEYVSSFQNCNSGDTSDEKWKMMDRIFYLYE